MSNLKGKKILVVNDHGPTYYKPFEFLGLECVRDHRVLETDPEDIALIVFTGGHDVSPSLYGKNAHPNTSSSMDRDIEETQVFEIAQENEIPMAGICRGAQFLCVMAGGKLVQDITGHHENHTVSAAYPDGITREIVVSSSHHQMQYPFSMVEDSYEVLAWGEEGRSEHYAFDDDNIILQAKADFLLNMEPDVVWYPQIKALAAQYHPEWMREDTDGFKYFQLLVASHLVPLMKERYDDDTPGKETLTSAG
jgi:anthranilate/para-aminobenzoate synthase component II